MLNSKHNSQFPQWRLVHTQVKMHNATYYTRATMATSVNIVHKVQLLDFLLLLLLLFGGSHKPDSADVLQSPHLPEVPLKHLVPQLIHHLAHLTYIQ